MSSEGGTARVPVVLGGYPAKRCARSVHNDFSPASPPRPSVDAATQKLFDAGNAFEARVNDRLAEAAGAVVLSDEDGWDVNIERTVAAMRSGAPLIVNGRLPRAGSMVGAPDVLVRLGEGYVPVDVKLHGTRRNTTRGSLWVSSLADPSVRWQATGLSDAGASVTGDGFQLAHYTRMLQELGFHAGDEHLIGGIIGQSDYTDLGGDPWLVTWYDLGTPRKDTYSASAESGRARRSLLERYDHEFAFRVMVAEEAKAGGELVRPFHVSECGWCVWEEYCTQVAGPDDASFAIRTGLPTAQQWRYLYDLGKATVADLAASGDELPTGWSPRDTQPGAMAEKKYRLLVRRARMAQAGVAFEPSGQWPTGPVRGRRGGLRHRMGLREPHLPVGVAGAAGPGRHHRRLRPGRVLRAAGHRRRRASRGAVRCPPAHGDHRRGSRREDRDGLPLVTPRAQHDQQVPQRRPSSFRDDPSTSARGSGITSSPATAHP